MSVGITSGSVLKTLLVDVLGRLRIYDDWSPYLESDVTADDSDKAIAVDADYVWKIKSIHIKLITTATAGNRQIVVEYRNGVDTVIAQFRAGIVQAASLTRYYQFTQQVDDLAAFRDTDLLTTPIPELVLDEAYDVHVYDNAAVDAAADDMEIQLLVERRSKES